MRHREHPFASRRAYPESHASDRSDTSDTSDPTSTLLATALMSRNVPLCPGNENHGLCRAASKRHDLAENGTVFKHRRRPRRPQWQETAEFSKPDRTGTRPMAPRTPSPPLTRRQLKLRPAAAPHTPATRATPCKNRQKPAKTGNPPPPPSTPHTQHPTPRPLAPHLSPLAFLYARPPLWYTAPVSISHPSGRPCGCRTAATK
jgi:hypothetical protein